MALVRASVANVYWGLGCLIFIVVVFLLYDCSLFVVPRAGGLNTVWIGIKHHSSFLFGFLISGKTV